MQISTGSTNTFVGSTAGSGNTTANFNTFIGYSAGSTNSTGNENTLIGYYSGYYNTTGVGNTLIGSQAGQSYSGSNLNYNVFLGDVSGRFNQGNNNVFLGYESGYNCQGSGNILIGYGAGMQLANSNMLIIENSTNITTPLIGGDFTNNRVGINRMPTTYTLEVGGTIWANGSTITAGSTTWSDARYKTDISPLTDALSDVLKMQGVRYNWRQAEFPELNFPKGEQIGVIAQDLEKILPELVLTGPDGYKSVSYEKLTPVLIEAIKEQQKQIEILKTELAQIKVLLEQRKGVTA